MVSFLTGQAALYLFGSDACQIFEIKAFHEEYRSWFISQEVQYGKWKAEQDIDLSDIMLEGKAGESGFLDALSMREAGSCSLM